MEVISKPRSSGEARCLPYVGAASRRTRMEVLKLPLWKEERSDEIQTDKINIEE